MLEGEASSFMGEEFIGKTRIKYTPVDGELEILLGVEERLVIKRDLKKRAVDKRLLRENRLLRYAFKIELKNLMDVTAEIEVQDQIPVSRHEEIKIKLEQAQPEPTRKTNLNLLEWQLELDPESEEVIRYEYLVEHPRSMQVVGLVD